MGRPFVVIGGLAAAWGASLSLLEHYRPVSFALFKGQTLDLISFVLSVGLLIWCRTHIGITRTAIWFGVGALLNTVLTGIDPENPWKYSLAVPVSIIVLGVVHATGSRVLEIVALFALAGVSLTSSSRAMIAFFVLAAAIVAWQILSKGRRHSPRPWQVIILIGALAVAAFNLFQGLLLEGMLGEAAQERTIGQIDTSGSLLTGGRPEIGASVALIGHRPWGYGSGTQPDSNDIAVAKTGMSDLNYDPNNGYVDRYMFGGQYEVHSVMGDLWIRFGPLGAFLLVLLLGVAVYALGHGIPQRTASGLVVFLVLRGVWDVFFSPALPSFRTLALLFAVAVIPLVALHAGRERQRVPADASPVES